MKQRGVFAIRVLILEALRHHPLSKTRLMQVLVLNYGRVGRYIPLMLHEGLIEYREIDKTYGITAKGLAFLELSEELAKMVVPINEMISKYRGFFETGEGIKEMHQIAG